MSEDETIGRGHDPDQLAAEYVLGVLSDEDRRLAEARLAAEPRFAAEVAFWEARLAGLAEEVQAVPPPPELWQRIEARIAAQPAPAATRAGLWQSLAFWRSFGLVSAGLAAACLAALIYVAAIPKPGGPLVADLAAKSGQGGFIAAANPADGSLTIVPAALLTGGSEKAYELWVIPPGGTPHSLGLIDPAHPVKVVVPRALLPHVSADSVLAVTLEPPGGSPTGLPTGPIIANGTLASL
jgi:anti-sigma-K factor RskA